MTFDKDFKIAIQNLSDKDKDKLILRLLKQNLTLANQLYFELVDTQSTEEYRKKKEIEIVNEIKRSSERFLSFGYIFFDLRYISGSITEHVKITKDKFGEISLNLLMLNEVLEQNKLRLLNAKLPKDYNFCMYVIARTFKILVLIKTFHEDYLIEFKSDLEKLGQQITESPILISLAIKNGLDINWLLNLDIPDNIKIIHQDLKNKGFLK